ncbi:hypothetical protein E2C01_084830 [Portunus trituberculatus]|uniref:Uncharacterized protein n=1 Tax=Portunus trituberculatus TaxID=210409 RepID=A0A5B7JAB4_PORTR|nr:hypothetical protein [Portunus trituberculatus]
MFCPSPHGRRDPQHCQACVITQSSHLTGYEQIPSPIILHLSPNFVQDVRVKDLPQFTSPILLLCVAWEGGGKEGENPYPTPRPGWISSSSSLFVLIPPM